MKFNKNLLGFFIVAVILLVVGFKFYKKNSKPKLYVINVLDKDLYDDCHIEGSINVPFEDIESFVNKVDKDAHVVTYCSNYMCSASGAAAKMFIDNGIKNVWAYEAGMFEWHNNKLPVGKDCKCKADYLKKENEVAKPVYKQEELKHIITTEELYNKINKMLNVSK